MNDRIRTGVATTARDQLPSGSRYELIVRIASGGMATVYVGRLTGVVGFSRLVAIKRAHAHLLEDPSFGRTVIEEARLASRIHHPNVVAVQDVEQVEGELLLVMDYVEGAALSELTGRPASRGGHPQTPGLAEELLSPPMVVRAVLDACAGLQAAHALTDDDGNPLGLVHRDVTPHNILIGVDGIGRLTDFGIARSADGSAGTRTGALKGKVAYMAPEYIDSGRVDVRGDVFALAVVAWEGLTGRRLFRGASDIETLKLVLSMTVPPPSSVAPSVGAALDDVLLKALEKSPDRRFRDAREFGEALEIAARRGDMLALHREVGERTRALVGDALDRRRALIRERNPHGRQEREHGAAEPSPSGRYVATDVGVPGVSVPGYRTSTLEAPAATPAEPTARGSSRSVQAEPPRRVAGSPGRTARRWGAVLGAVLVTVALVAVLPGRPGSSTEATKSAATTAPAPMDPIAVATTATTAPPTPAPPDVAPIAVPPSATPMASGAPRPARPRPRTRATTSTRPAEVAPVAPEADKAPPNPYAAPR